MDICEIRHKLHNNPGVSAHEEFAHDLVSFELAKLAPTELHQRVGGYGCVAFWKSSTANAKTLAFRADIDALPSGHRCGHDGHTAILLRFASMIAREQLKYNVVLIFQPEEETGKGAKKIVQSGLLQQYGVDAVFGLHNIPGYTNGSVLLNKGTFAAASCGVLYRLIGRQTHASTPEKGLNPGLAIAKIIERMHKLNNYSGSSLRLSTLICCRIGTEAYGTSPGMGEVMFTLRTDSNDKMTELMSAADGIALEEARNAGLELEKQVKEPFRATENSPAIVEQLNSIFSTTNNVVMMDKCFRWSEDFAEYLKVFPGAFFGLGSGENQPELHNPYYDFPDDIIDLGANCFHNILDNIKID